MKLRHAADVRTLAFAAAFFALLVFAWVVDPSGWPKVPVVMALAVLSFIGAVATHNAMHTPVFRARAANRAFQCILTLWGGQTVTVYVPGHNLSHHKALESPQDMMRTSKARWRWNLLNGLFFLGSVRSMFVAEAHYARLMRRTNRAFFRQYVLEYVVYAGTVVVLGVVDWHKLLSYVLVPWAYSIWGIVTINYLQHDGCDPASRYDHSRNFVGRFVNWLVLNNGYHTIHHMKPALHWSQLPAEHARTVRPFIHPVLEQPSVVAYIVRTFIWPGRRLRYDGQPVELPAPTPDDLSWMTRTASQAVERDGYWSRTSTLRS